MTLVSQRISRAFLIASLLSVLTGCTTLQHRSVQSRFQEAVRVDNERFTVPFTDVVKEYRSVADEISDAYIAGLDPKLRPNAWTLRAVSQWRSEQYAAAVSSAHQGLAELSKLHAQSPELEGGRDGILLTMLPGLVEDSRLRQRWSSRGADDLAAHYDEYASKFRVALRALSEAQEKMSAATPVEVVHYWRYQSWRVLQNWFYTIGQLPFDVQAEASRTADAFVKTTLSTAKLANVATLKDAIQSVSAALPMSHPFRQLIDLESAR